MARYLPPEMIIEILSRLPIRTIIRFKLVCKSWRDLIQTREFADSHLSKPGSGLVTCRYNRHLKVYEFVDEELDLEHTNLHYTPVTELDCKKSIGSEVIVRSSAKGLLLLETCESEPYFLYVCNPITRQYIKLREDGMFRYPSTSFELITYGFGLSEMSRRYKVVRIVQERIVDRGRDRMKVVVTSCVCQVYTLGTGKWWSVPTRPLLGLDGYFKGSFINGSLHWLAKDSQGSDLISCFDLETEIFSTFSLPPLLVMERRYLRSYLVALEDYLCVYDETSDDEIVIWLMKEYGNARSWTKEFVIKGNTAFLRCGPVFPIKVFENGDFLIALVDSQMAYYSSKTKAFRFVEMFGVHNDGSSFETLLHSSSFLSLNSFPVEIVRSF